jgi:hypothetical protein
MVARSVQLNSPAVVPKLILETEEEKQFFEAGASRTAINDSLLIDKGRSIQRKQKESVSLVHKPPTDEERGLIHRHLFLIPKKIEIPENISKVPVSVFSTRMKQTNLMQVEYRNMYGKVCRIFQV